MNSVIYWPACGKHATAINRTFHSSFLLNFCFIFTQYSFDSEGAFSDFFFLWWQMNTHRTSHSNRSANNQTIQFTTRFDHYLLLKIYTHMMCTLLTIITTTILFGLTDTDAVDRNGIPRTLKQRTFKLMKGFQN